MAGRLARIHSVGPKTDWLESPLWMAYSSLLELLEAGQCEEASAAARDLRLKDASAASTDAVRSLISARIAMKKTHLRDKPALPSCGIEEAPWLEGECEFVQGLFLFHQGEFARGAEHFARAEEAFMTLDMRPRELLAAFNALIGRSYAGQFASPLLEINGLSHLEKRTRDAIEERPSGLSRCRKVLAMIHRQKAAILEENSRLNAAINELSKAIEIFALEGPVSDHHLALLLAADLSLDLGDERGARTFFEYVLPPMDTRVEFPFAFVESRLTGKSVSLAGFTLVPPGWKERFEASLTKRSANIPTPNPAPTQIATVSSFFAEPGLQWNMASGEMTSEASGEKWKIRAASLEGTVIKMLAKGPASKALLIETLWPEHCEVAHLDHRLHQLISRMNGKVPGLVVFDGFQYRLSMLVKML